jgi:hypothetical protein
MLAARAAPSDTEVSEGSGEICRPLRSRQDAVVGLAEPVGGLWAGRPGRTATTTLIAHEVSRERTAICSTLADGLVTAVSDPEAIAAEFARKMP